MKQQKFKKTGNIRSFYDEETNRKLAEKSNPLKLISRVFDFEMIIETI